MKRYQFMPFLMILVLFLSACDGEKTISKTSGKPMQDVLQENEIKEHAIEQYEEFDAGAYIDADK